MKRAAALGDDASSLARQEAAVRGLRPVAPAGGTAPAESAADRFVLGQRLRCGFPDRIEQRLVGQRGAECRRIVPPVGAAPVAPTPLLSVRRRRGHGRVACGPRSRCASLQ